ncbi:MAG: DUF4079 family protein, partial [Candidatus Entotheonellia bacterium]
LGFMTWREGLALRKLRRGKAPAGTYAVRRARHVRLGKSCLWTIAGGYLLGVGELIFVREEPILRSAHFYFATLTLVLLGWGALYGFALLRGTTRDLEYRELHSFLLPLALFLLVGVGVLGLRLLP